MQPFKGGLLIGAVVVALITGAAGCGGAGSTAFVAGVRNAKSATLYEGLPHQMFEAGALQQELASKATVQLSGYPFYQEALAISEADERALREIVCADDSFAAFSGEKNCGGFHPDYCIEWRTSKGEAFRVLVCFGCHEVKLCTSGDETRCDIRDPALARLKTILTAFQKNRPARAP